MKIVLVLLLAVFAYGYDESQIIDHIKSVLQKSYAKQNIIIRKISITPSAKIDVEGFTVKEIGFSAKEAQKSSGTFWVSFEEGANKKKIFFKYDVEATLEVLKTKESLKNSIPLSMQNTKLERIPLRLISFELASSDDIDSSETASYLPANSIIYKNRLKESRAVKKGERVFASFAQSAISIDVEAVAKESGRVGDTIMIETKDKKLLRAKVVGKNSVEVR